MQVLSANWAFDMCVCVPQLLYVFWYAAADEGLLPHRNLPLQIAL